MNETITAVPGVRVGHWTDPVAQTGCTVVVFPEPNVATAEARGAAPGTREYALLQPEMRVEQVQAILLTGGSAFGLSAATGVMQELEREGRGHETALGPVPIVPAAVLFDLYPGDPTVRPGPEQGAEAYRNATGDPVPMGRVGAGTGATAAKWRGFEHIVPGGLGSAIRKAGDAVVGAIVAVNAVGDVFTVTGEPLTGGAHEPGPPNLVPAAFTENTTLVVVATDAALDRIELRRLVYRAHDAIAACIRPAHTRWDGDIVFAVSCGSVEADCDTAAEAAFGATAAAIEAAVRAASA